MCVREMSIAKRLFTSDWGGFRRETKKPEVVKSKKNLSTWRKMASILLGLIEVTANPDSTSNHFKGQGFVYFFLH